MKNHLAKNIKLIRTSQNLSQEIFASKLGLKRATIGTYETGKNEPTIKTLINISKLYKVTIDDLIKTELRVEIRYEGLPF